MESFLEVATTGDLPEGTLKSVTVQGSEILLARAGGRVFAVQGRCPHFRADLSKGTLTGTILTCPLHHSQFDLRDGSVVRWTDLQGILLKAATVFRAPRPLTVYPVKIEGDRILVSFGSP